MERWAPAPWDGDVAHALPVLPRHSKSNRLAITMEILQKIVTPLCPCGVPSPVRQRSSPLLTSTARRDGVLDVRWRARCEGSSRWADGRVMSDDVDESSSELRYCSSSGVD